MPMLTQLVVAPMSQVPPACPSHRGRLTDVMFRSIVLFPTLVTRFPTTPTGSEPTVQEIQSALKDIRINLLGNQLRAYAVFILYGKEISLQLDGTITTEGGYIRLQPTAGKLGSLPIPSLTLDRVVHQLFDSPSNRDKFQLPPQIESVRVENNSLVISTR